MREVTLNSSSKEGYPQAAFVDDEDFERVSAYKWYRQKRQKTFYAISPQKGHVISLHRFIMQAPKGVLVDHKDRDGLNCQKSNMRLCNGTQNRANSVHKRSGNHSNYRGVVRSRNKWNGQIKVRGKQIYLGTFTTPEEAAKAYDEAAKLHFGEFAFQNFT